MVLHDSNYKYKHGHLEHQIPLNHSDWFNNETVSQSELMRQNVSFLKNSQSVLYLIWTSEKVSIEFRGTAMVGLIMKAVHQKVEQKNGEREKE